MNEVEKLYENAGVEPKKNCYYWDCPYSTGNVGEDDKKEKDCENCNNPDKKTYPPFTAEKQLNIIKWLMRNRKDYQYDTYNDTYWFIIDDYRECKLYQNFDEALAELINLYWQDFDKEERNSIKEILND